MEAAEGERSSLAGPEDIPGLPAAGSEVQGRIEDRPGQIRGERPPEFTRGRGAASFVDREHLKAITEGLDEEAASAFISSLFVMAAADCERSRAPLGAACSTRDPVKLAALVHGLMGGAATVGWTRLAARCLEVMNSAREQTFVDWDSLPAEMNGFLRPPHGRRPRYSSSDAFADRVRSCQLRRPFPRPRAPKDAAFRPDDRARSGPGRARRPYPSSTSLGCAAPRRP